MSLFIVFPKVNTTPGSLLITSGQIGWTAKCTTALADGAKAKKALRRLRAEWHEYLNKLAKYVRGDLDKLESIKLVALITIEVHARDVIDKLRVAAKNKVNVNSFEWTSQLRFYFEKPTGGDFGKAIVKQTNTQHVYGYEYQGNNGRLVITALTDRCYMTLTTALHLCRGGSPMGPAGTGKTETVKDLGKGLGKFVVVFNCSPVDGVDSLSRNFSGLSQTGAWGCFDEFNRIIVEVLSVVALQVTSILEAVRTKATTFVLDGKKMNLNPTVGIFVTMNPAGAGYTGRSKIPDNLASLFRPVAMMVPDATAIAEIMMMSQGFSSANVLAKKLTTILDLMDQQLSKQDHYAGGLRAINSILNRAAQLSRSKENDLSEELILMRALKDLNHSKLIAEDAVLFDALMGDLFPNVEMPVIEYGLLKTEIETQSLAMGLVVCDAITFKTIQLYEVMSTRHGNMLVGGTNGGKSTAWNLLQRSLTALNKVKPDDFPIVEVSIMNPKAVTTDELFGMYDLITKEWTDGILAVLMKNMCTSESDTNKWLLLDGPVDTLWIESMNTVLDDNKVLTLVNGDRISLLPNVKLLFEVQDLSTASPATVSRAGMVYCDVNKLGWRPMMDAWIAKKHKLLAESLAPTEEDKAKKPKKFPFTKESIEYLPKLVEKYITPMLRFRDEDPEAKDLIPAGEFCVARGFTRLFDSVCSVKNGVDPSDEAQYLRMMEMWFAFAVMWTIGGPLTAAARARFDTIFRDLETQFPPLQQVFDYYVDPVKKEWIGWDEKVSATWRPTAGTPFSRIVVPTIDTVRHSFILTRMMETRTPFLIVGGTGTGKTSLISNYLGSLPDSYLPLTANFSAATSSRGLQDIIESRLEKRQRNNFGPVGSRKSLILFIDDLNMPKKEEYGTQPPLELLRQWYDYGFWFDREKQSQKNIVDMQMVASMGPPGGARSTITPCFQSRFNVVNFPFPADSQVKSIFRSIISNHLVNFDEALKPLAVPMTNAIVELYKQVADEFLPTPACCHYLFNMRDISRVFQGILRGDQRYLDTKESMVRLWVHEVLRVFYDRLINEDDKGRFVEMLNAKLLQHFEVTMTKLFDKGVSMPVFADFLEEENAVIRADDDETDDSKLPYHEVGISS
jgi:dynein heavy chain